MDADFRVILVTQDFPPTEGGIARGYADLARGFPAGSFIVSATRPDGPAGPPAPGIPIEYEPFTMARAHRFVSGLRWRRDLERLVARLRPGLLICGNVRPVGPLCRDVARRHRIPYYIIVHGNDLLAARRHWSGLRSITWSRVFGDARRWITNSEAVLRIGTDQLNLPAEKSGVILPEVDTALFHPGTPDEKSEIRHEMGIAPESAVVIFIGRLVARKGLDRLIEAMSHLDTRQPWQLIVAGYGDPSPYRALAERAGIGDRLIFHSGVSEPDLRRLLRASDIAAMPSRTIPERGDIEGFGIVYLEAAASGLPIVAGDSGGVVEAVQDGVTGIVVDGNNADAIRHAIERLLADPALRAKMGRAGRVRTAESFGPGSRAAQLMTIIKDDFGRT